jgi:hypothetical protein
MLARTCSSSIPTNASIVACANRNVRPRRSSRTPNRWAKLNREYAAKWPNITVRDTPLADAKEWDGVPGKLNHFTPAPHDEVASEEMAECTSEVAK